MNTTNMNIEEMAEKIFRIVSPADASQNVAENVQNVAENVQNVATNEDNGNVQAKGKNAHKAKKSDKAKGRNVFADNDNKREIYAKASYPHAKRSYKDAHFHMALSGEISLHDATSHEPIECSTEKGKRFFDVIGNDMKDISAQIRKIASEYNIPTIKWNEKGNARDKGENPKIELLGTSFQFSTYSATFKNEKRPCYIGKKYVTFFEDNKEGNRIGYELTPAYQDKITLRVHVAGKKDKDAE